MATKYDPGLKHVTKRYELQGLLKGFGLKARTRAMSLFEYAAM